MLPMPIRRAVPVGMGIPRHAYVTMAFSGIYAILMCESKLACISHMRSPCSGHENPYRSSATVIRSHVDDISDKRLDAAAHVGRCGMFPPTAAVPVGYASGLRVP